MRKRLIIFLIRRRLGLKLFEDFRFSNQKSKYDRYYFAPDALIKREYCGGIYRECNANVSLNWLLDDECEIVKVGGCDG